MAQALRRQRRPRRSTESHLRVQCQQFLILSYCFYRLRNPQTPIRLSAPSPRFPRAHYNRLFLETLGRLTSPSFRKSLYPAVWEHMMKSLQAFLSLLRDSATTNNENQSLTRIPLLFSDRTQRLSCKMPKLSNKRGGVYSI